MLRMPSSLESRHRLLHLRASLETELHPADVSTDGNWILSPSRTMSLRGGRLHGNRHGRTEEQRQHFIAHNSRKRCIKKEFWRNSRSLPERFKISWLVTQNWSNWRNMHPDERGGAERFHLSHVVRRVFEIQEELVDLSQHTRNAPMKLRSDFPRSTDRYAPLHRESGEERPEPIPLHQYQRWHSSSSSSTSWWQWNEHWWNS